MAVRNDFAPGEVLAAADLNDTFASRVPFAFGTATPTTTTTGFLWYDTNFTPPVGKVWNGSAFVNFSQGPADFSDAATGTYTDGGINYKYITYTASGTLTVTRAGFADVLVVGGGGGGANGQSGVYNSGGGGAGGYLQGLVYLEPGSFQVVIGAGGASNTSGNVSFLETTASVFVSAIAGGRGAGASGSSSQIGGSGGGGNFITNAGSVGTTRQGNKGGDGTGATPFRSGGGGGAGSAGTDGAAQATAGLGGNGLASGITGASVTRGGGGGGGSSLTASEGGGGTGGGGGGGAPNNAGTAGTANTGGGGGGGAENVSAAGGAGGSGVVIVRVRT
jgi:hypothetical protein